MKKEIHPDNYREVIFDDSTSGKRFLIGSTIATSKKDKWTDGKEYPVYQHRNLQRLASFLYRYISKTIDTAGRVDKVQDSNCSREENDKGR
jgi:large subunit ribosomal protein L31